MPQAISATVSGDASIIQGYTAGHFRISGTVYQGGVFVMPETVISWSETALDTLKVDSFSPLAEHGSEIDILLLGTGSDFGFVSATLRRGIKDRFGLGVDFMDTGAACRTFNMLQAENRRVAAALLPVT